ncbi:hypothetical protein [Saezia sanguinis]|uniref:hypothetical protein n=1 Tax=Saezia sanguinis TaxID=1965230 RepID=UPI00304EDAE6
MHAQPPTALMQYAALHRDQRNILLHTICIPIMMLAMGWLLSPLLWQWPNWPAPAGALLLLGITGFYVYFAGYLGLVTSVLIAVLFCAGQLFYSWLGLISGSIVLLLGYLLHRLGHWYEGNYFLFRFQFPTLLAAPLFATAEIMRHLGFFHPLCAAIETRVGTSYVRDMVNVQSD